MVLLSKNTNMYIQHLLIQILILPEVVQSVTVINNKCHDTLSRLYSLLLNKLLKHDLKLIKTPSN